MTRRWAWAEVGQRALGHAPHSHWKTTTFLAGLTSEGLIAPFVLDGPMNGECFKAYVAHVLVPELKPGDVVILDNLSSHKSQEAARLIAEAGAQLAERVGAKIMNTVGTAADSKELARKPPR